MAHSPYCNNKQTHVIDYDVTCSLLNILLDIGSNPRAVVDQYKDQAGATLLGDCAGYGLMYEA